MVNKTVKVYFLINKKTKKKHFIYIIDETLFIDPTYIGLEFHDISYLQIFLRLFTIKGVKTVDISNNYKNIWFRPSLYNCISVGKHLLGIKGIFLNCESFFNKIK